MTQTHTIETYGPPRIAHAANEIQRDEVEDEYEAKIDETEAIIDDLREGGVDPIGQLLFARRITQEYGTGKEYPAEQRDLSGTDDWRQAVTRGLWHIIRNSIVAELTRRENKGSDIIASTEKTVQHEVDPDELIEAIDEFVSRIREYAASDDHHPLEVLDDDDIQELIGTSDDEFMRTLLIMDDYTTRFHLETWDGMMDTAVREGLNSGDFCENIIETVLPDLVMNLPPEE